MSAVPICRIAALLFGVVLVVMVLSTAPAYAQGASDDRTGNDRPGSNRHWSLQPVQRPPVPATTPALANPIDAFVQARLAATGLTLSGTATRATLIRRLYLVMLGLPPSPKDVAEFVSDQEPGAFDRLVDTVLADARYGERWARHWLDVVRFAESDGFETNHQRPNAWRYRDYVIDAFNRDKPYDQFVREQLAGDALGADVATGFLVAGQVDIVGSPDPVLTAQQRADQLDDIVATTGSAFLGMTVGCARCHSHKFDPIEHREYYALTAVFAGVGHGERDLPMPPQQALKLARMDERIAVLEQQLAPFAVPVPDSPAVGSTLRPAVDFARNEEAFAPVVASFVRLTIFATSNGQPCIDELEVWAGDQNVALASAGTIATASSTLPGYDIHKLKHSHDGVVGNGHSWISNEVGGGWLQFEFAQPARIDRIVWARDRTGVVRDRLAVSYRIEAAVRANEWQVIASSADRTAFAGATKAHAAPMYRFDAVAPDAAATSRLDQGHLQQDRLDKGHALLIQRRTLERQRAALSQPPKAYAGTFTQPGPVHLLSRGDPMQPAELVAPGTLALFRPIQLRHDTPEQQRRLQLADWIVAVDHPLTARVLVNRIWQHQFGTGIVSTPSDFGRNGALPSHPELLDWLAKEFVASGWSIKALQRLILTSATWRQGSTPKDSAVRLDRGSRLLWRYPPRRLAAEAIRDCMLAVSGELNQTAGGPSFSLHDIGSEYVRHYRPKEEFGPDESRRMIYALKVRTEPDLVFTAFDCPDGSLTMPQRGLSTTPLQSLNLWNSKFILQQANAMAQRLGREAGDQHAAAIKRAWQLVYQRAPTLGEVSDAVALVQSHGLPALCRALLNSNEFLFLP
ncbi:MAG: hypothetical protein ACI9SE_003851 [Neolewinella sp.]|jgi:hypothetical protein